MALKLKNKCVICSELIEMCNLMSIEIGYFSNDTKTLVNNLAKEPSLAHLKFLNDYNPEKICISTELSEAEDEKLNALFRMLGTTDSSSMLDMLDSFRLYMEESKNKYKCHFNSHGRLYIAFGIFSGIAVSIVLV